MRPTPFVLLAAFAASCSGDTSGQTSGSGSFSGTDTQTTTASVTSDTASSSSGSGSSSDSDSATTTSASGSTGVTTTGQTTSASDTGPKFDVGMATAGSGTTGDPPNVCKVGGDGDGTKPCRTKAPPDSFEPVLQWSWAGDGNFNDSIVTPLVANLTDDNNDGEIDLCDVPDVLVMVNDGSCNPANLYVLDGATGTLHFQIPGPFARASTPAIGDIDNDGLPEIVVQSGATSCNGASVSVFEHDGTLKWTQDHGLALENAIALADLDNDGDVEIIVRNVVIDHLGALVFQAADTQTIGWTTTTAADLDGDGDLEVVLGRSAYHHDGTEMWMNAAEKAGQPAVGDMDDDGLPEIINIENQGFSIYEHDGTVKQPSINPTGDTDWRRPATIHDLDGDDQPEFAVSSRNTYSSFEGDATQNWAMPVADNSGLASGTAFDFLGDGIAEALYADESWLWVFDGQTGAELLKVPRGSITIVEYPVVADVDNDGSSEIIVVSNHANNPTVQVYRDGEDRWIQSRRIWNQHTYHVTNVREDATIPQNESPHWLQLNTFRTNAQIEGGSVCDPEG